MLYSKHITFLAGKTEETLTRLTFKINQGIIYRAWLVFPSGCSGLVKIRVYHEEHPIIPENKTDYVKGNDYVFEIPIYLEVEDEPYTVTFEGWNEDETYNHTITLMLLVLPKSFVLPVGATEGIMESLKSLIIRPIIMQQKTASEV